MNAHRQAIESAWDNLLEAIADAAQDARTKPSAQTVIMPEIAAKLDTLHAAVRGLGNAWAGVRDLLPIESIEIADRSDVPGALPESEYWKPLAKVLHFVGGPARAGDVIAAVGTAMVAKLQPIDRDLLPTGEVRWINRIRFARQRLKEHGLISRNTAYGCWELTDAGKRWAQSDLTNLAKGDDPDPRQQAFLL